jgi:hypothetical protein
MILQGKKLVLDFMKTYHEFMHYEDTFIGLRDIFEIEFDYIPNGAKMIMFDNIEKEAGKLWKLNEMSPDKKKIQCIPFKEFLFLKEWGEKLISMVINLSKRI